MGKTSKAETCPRCGGPLRGFPGDLGGLSRSDNKTIVCGPCSGDEVNVWLGLPAQRTILPAWERTFREGMTRQRLQAERHEPD